MIGKLACAGVLALALNPSQAKLPPPTFVYSDYIEKISCLTEIDGEMKTVAGTGFKLADGRWASVNHVTRHQRCLIDGRPILVSHFDHKGDFSIFTVPGDERRGGYEIDCRGFVDRHWYHAIGHAGGRPVLTSLPLLYAAMMDWAGSSRGWSVLVYNRVIPGMSGGPIVGSDGRVAGVVNAFNPFMPLSFSRALKETPLCANA